MTQEDKNNILDQVSVNILKVASLQMLAEESDLTDEAERLQRQKKQLRTIYDQLAAEAFQNWIGEAEIIKKDLETSQSGLEKIIRDIEQQQAIVENIVKAIGKIEEIVQKVKNILPLL